MEVNMARRLILLSNNNIILCVIFILADFYIIRDSNTSPTQTLLCSVARLSLKFWKKCDDSDEPGVTYIRTFESLTNTCTSVTIFVTHQIMTNSEFS